MYQSSGSSFLRSTDVSISLLSRCVANGAKKYLRKTLTEPLRRIIHRKISFEIDPSKLIDKTQDIKSNLIHLQDATESVLNAIWTSHLHLPPFVKETIVRLFEQIEISREIPPVTFSRVVASFWFLRIVIPCIAMPHTLLREKEIGKDAHRNLILVAKLINLLCHSQLRLEDADILKPAVPWIERQSGRMEAYASDLRKFKSETFDTGKSKKHEYKEDVKTNACLYIFQWTRQHLESIELKIQDEFSDLKNLKEFQLAVTAMNLAVGPEKSAAEGYKNVWNRIQRNVTYTHMLARRPSTVNMSSGDFTEISRSSSIQSINQLDSLVPGEYRSNILSLDMLGRSESSDDSSFFSENSSTSSGDVPKNSETSEFGTFSEISENSEFEEPEILEEKLSVNYVFRCYETTSKKMTVGQLQNPDFPEFLKWVQEKTKLKGVKIKYKDPSGKFNFISDDLNFSEFLKSGTFLNPETVSLKVEVESH
eukprot:TRINITY_DN3093_c0_g1_i1.p1 TRINITY_DN3093_c0_g1~~TRINITY_DN3093_c0_g1_i1.p1  ORF type:complete len:480 (-),score=163.03 TRINITY_DN3093_c0_g1_i1:24-1463(-)